MYHPGDGATGTYDIAVLEIADTSDRLRSLGVVPVQLEPTDLGYFKDGLRVGSAGYPVDYADRESSLEKPEPLPPLRIAGTVSQVPLEALAQNGFEGILREGYFAKTVERPLGKGASGGTIYVEDGGHAVRVVGVVLGSADVQIKKNGRTISETGFVFASSQRITEAIP